MAIKKGGKWICQYPVHPNNYHEGVLLEHWEGNKAAGCSMSKPDEVSSFVG
jgi:hypothetical protein